MFNLFKLVLAGSISVVLLSACGGGGGGGDSAPAAQTSTAPTPVTSFALQAGYKARLASGSVGNYVVSGTCSGTMKATASSPSSSTFESATALAITTTLTMSVTNCTPASQAVTAVSYIDSNYNPLGSSIAGTEYAKFLTVPSPLPTSVKIGDTAIYGTEAVYTDSSKQTSKGQRTFSYVVEQDGTSTTTAIVNLITKDTNTSNQLLVTAQSRARITADGTITPVTIDVQYSTTSTNHFIYTAN